MLPTKPVMWLGTLASVVLGTALPAAAAVPADSECGTKNILFTGVPPSHPLVEMMGAKLGVDPKQVGPKLQQDSQNILAAGYNLKVVLMGPEQPLKHLEDEMQGTKWDGLGIGYGIRGPPIPQITERLEDIIDLYKTKSPSSRILFNYSPETALWAIERRFPLNSNCSGSPGKMLGTKIFCDVCKQS